MKTLRAIFKPHPAQIQFLAARERHVLLLVTINARDRDGSVKDSKLWFVCAQNVEDARKVLSFEVHTLLIDEWAE